MTAAASHPTDPGALELRLRGVSHPLDRERTLLGRSRSCDVRVKEDSVSRLHAALVWRDGELFLEDLGSSNGTRCNGRQVTSPCAVHAGDRITFGAVEGVVVAGGAPAEPESGDGGPGEDSAGDPDENGLAVVPGGFLRRAAAALVNIVVFAAGSAVPFAPLAALALYPHLLASPGATPPTAGVQGAVAAACGVLWLIYAWYYVVHGWARRGGTIGLRLMGLRLTDWKGRSPVGYSRAWLRLIALGVTVLTLGAGFLLIVLRRDRRALHDVLAGTRVVRRNGRLGGTPTPA